MNSKIPIPQKNFLWNTLPPQSIDCVLVRMAVIVVCSGCSKLSSVKHLILERENSMQEKDQKVSRRMFLTLGSTAAATPFLLSGSSIYANGLNSTFPNPNLIIVQDPATALAVAGAGLDVAIKLKQLFGKNSKGGDTKLLADIQRQNAQIIRMLGEVLIILGNLGVTIRAGVRDELLNHIKETLKVAFGQFYDTWEAELKNPGDSIVRVQATDKYKRFHNTIADIGRQVASTESYGYAHFQTVGHAMLVEMWISHRVEEARAFRLEAAETYATYFETVLNPKEVGSVAAQLVAAQTQVARMDTILVNADNNAAGYPKSEVVGQKTKQKGRTISYYDIVRTMAGDRISGYSYNDTSVLTKTERDRPEHPFLSNQEALSQRTDPSDTGSKSIAGRVKYLNSVRAVYLAAKSEAEALEKSKDTASLYLDIAREISSNP